MKPLISHHNTYCIIVTQIMPTLYVHVTGQQVCNRFLCFQLDENHLSRTQEYLVKKNSPLLLCDMTLWTFYITSRQVNTSINKVKNVLILSTFNHNGMSKTHVTTLHLQIYILKAQMVKCDYLLKQGYCAKTGFKLGQLFSPQSSFALT